MPSPLCPLLCRVMMLLTQRLPVALVPEQVRVTLVRADVVNHCGRGDAPYLLAHATERVALKVVSSGLAPSAVIAAAGCAASVVPAHAPHTYSHPPNWLQPAGTLP